MCSKKKGLSINHINMTHSDKRNLSTSCSFKQILAQQHTCLQLQLLHIIAPCHTILKPFFSPPKHNTINATSSYYSMEVWCHLNAYCFIGQTIKHDKYTALQKTLQESLQGIGDKNRFSSWTTSYFSLNTHKNIQLETYSSTLLWSLEFQSSDELKCRHSCAKMSRRAGQSPHHCSNCDSFWKRRILVIFLATKKSRSAFFRA